MAALPAVSSGSPGGDGHSLFPSVALLGGAAHRRAGFWEASAGRPSRGITEPMLTADPGPRAKGAGACAGQGCPLCPSAHQSSLHKGQFRCVCRTGSAHCAPLPISHPYTKDSSGACAGQGCPLCPSAHQSSLHKGQLTGVSLETAKSRS